MNVLDELRKEAALRGRYERNKFTLMLGGVVIVSLVLVSVAMSVYNTSEAAQLDLSGPRYAGVRDQVVQNKAISTFPSSGSFNQQAFDDFYKAYDQHVQAMQQVNGYDPAAVNNDSFNLTAPTATPAP